MNNKPKGFHLYIPNAKVLSNYHDSMTTLAQNFHLREILKENEDLFLADTANILTIMMQGNDYQYATMTTRQEESLINTCVHEYVPMMESSIMQSIEDHACQRSGRSNDHYYTLDMIESMMGDYECWLNQKYGHDKKPISVLIIEAILQAHMNVNIPSIIHTVNKYKPEKAFPDLQMNTSTVKNQLLSVKFI